MNEEGRLTAGRPGAEDECTALRVDGYEMDEVLLPAAGKHGARKAIRVVIRGRNFTPRAIPLWAFIGKVPIKYLRLLPGARTLEGVLLEEPPHGSYLRVSYADTEVAQHPKPFDPDDIKRID